MKYYKLLSVIIMALAWLMAAVFASTPQQQGTGEYRDDSVITARVKSAILQYKTLKSAEINNETYKGSLQLNGFVNSEEDIVRADEVPHKVLGVKSVMNDMLHK